MVHDVREVVADSGGLMFIDEEEQTLYYVHHSVKIHLFNIDPQGQGYCTTQLDLHQGFFSVDPPQLQRLQAELGQSQSWVQPAHPSCRPGCDLRIRLISAGSASRTEAASEPGEFAAGGRKRFRAQDPGDYWHN
jgi:hypothetical protein